VTISPTAAPDLPPTAIPTLLYVSEVDPTLAERALASDLPSPAKLALLSVLCHPIGALVQREDLAEVHPSIAEHLDEALGELVDGHWLMTVPAGERCCRAQRFQLRLHDHDQHDPPSRVPHVGGGVAGGGGGVAGGGGDDDAPVTHLGAGGDPLVTPWSSGWTRVPRARRVSRRLCPPGAACDEGGRQPAEGTRMPVIILIVVDLPAPFGPA
jgi:hypothetical protein